MPRKSEQSEVGICLGGGCQNHPDGTALLQSHFINYEINMPLPGTKNPICSVLWKGMMLRTGA